ncbi:NAD-glutamate dehydrogenase [Pilimelia terevasa]|uniref:NAD-glutamate dehydrogenase n=1 Tax=Pilimelia terevasa TaxID=53372 RepID=A0A8J3FII5_9ACTN|nr:NAD-glutamate dehydrogenase [Pilimelia terevasa]GGK19245.1 NAD-glutamate dehydrogenase [Pilimelia terevasa]
MERHAGVSVGTTVGAGPTRDGEAVGDGPPSAEHLIAAAAAAAADDAERALVARYWMFAPDEDLAGRTPEQLLAAVRQHAELAARRVGGELKLRIGEPAPGDHHTVVEIATDDMPFLVDSVTAALAAQHLDVRLIVHPLLVVRREALGQLVQIADREPDEAGPGEMVESWIRIEIDIVRDPAKRVEVQRALQRVLTDVRESVEDWPRMQQRALELADELREAQLPVPDKDISDSVELLRWLVEDNFTFLGYREYRLIDAEGEDGSPELMLQAVLGSGLGILRSEPAAARVLSSMTPEAYAKALERRLLTITKANSRATVHRNAYLDYIGFKTFDDSGAVVGERRFLGLFSSSAYLTSVRELPVVKRKVAEVLDRSGLTLRSHSGRDLMDILESYPRDELFHARTDELFHTVLGVLRMAGRRQLRLFLRRDDYGRFISCLIFLPRDRFTTANRLKMQAILLRELNGVGVDYTTRVSESVLARVHFIVRTDPHNPPGDVDTPALAEKLNTATRAWEDDFRIGLEAKFGESQARILFDRYAPALTESYKDEHTAFEAGQDMAKLELLEEPGQLELHLFRKRKDDDDVRFKVFRYGEPMLLSAVLPVLHSLGVKVADEHPFEVRRTDGTIYLYDFGLQLPEGHRALTEVRAHVENAFSATWRGEAEVDGFNELVLRAGLTWRQVVVLRAYAKYLRQAGTVFSQEYMEQTFIGYPQIARLLVRLFEARFAPAVHAPAGRDHLARDITTAIGLELEGVTSLDQDRILRSYLTLIQATLRTSFFQRASTADGGRPKPYVSFKLDPTAIPDLPAPRPKFEIFVYSPRFEGVHLRFGAVARGGLRWSDRREDFRTEVLGLVKAQMVKNAVIVPVGAKGGFVLKQKPGDRDEAVACYRMFIAALLDVTDNIVAGAVVPPTDVVRHDGDDPYLVVAADKGTATFSDIANEISANYGFWMGDAFASGGSAGYDHKGMGITARGAWESVKRHFRDLGVDTQSQEFTVVGVGDMSGDVFGNGMLLSAHIRLVAAFDHRHIFIDPDPDAATSFAERSRMFALPRSSWADYDPTKISAGGAVFPRTMKSIELTPQIRDALHIEPTVAAMTPPELMKAILQAPVDLLWNGGIGTYVKGTGETHLDVGDKANDAIRVNGAQLRVKVVGEGGNLGLTQRGRIEFATYGGRIFTDFIDNSAGVDCSDHEVNIKILLGSAVADGTMTLAERDALLVEMTDEVADLVLQDNYDQARALGNAGAQALSLLPVHRRMIIELERSGHIDRVLESLPTDSDLQIRGESGRGLTMPEFAVLLAFVKIAMEEEILASELPDDPWTADLLVDYFPTPLRKRFADRMTEHRLRREIITTALVNEVVNRGGTSFVYRAVEETGASVADILRAYVVVREVYGFRELWQTVEDQDNRISTDAQTALYLESRRLLDRAVRWLVSSRPSPLDVAGETARLRPGVADLLPRTDALFRGAERQSLRAHVAHLAEGGVPADLAERSTRMVYSFGLLDIVEIAANTGHEVGEVAGVYFELSERFRVDNLLSKVSYLPRNDRWQTLARMALRYDLYAALAGLTNEVLAGTASGLSPEDRVRRWEEDNATAITRTRNAVTEFGESPADLAALSVLLRQIRTLVRTSRAS